MENIANSVASHMIMKLYVAFFHTLSLKRKYCYTYMYNIAILSVAVVFISLLLTYPWLIW